MIVISPEAMRLAIAATERSYKQIMIMYSVNLDNLPLPPRSDCGKILLAGGDKIYRSFILQKKIAKLTAHQVQMAFKVNNKYCILVD